MYILVHLAIGVLMPLCDPQSSVSFSCMNTIYILMHLRVQRSLAIHQGPWYLGWPLWLGACDVLVVLKTSIVSPFETILYIYPAYLRIYLSLRGHGGLGALVGPYIQNPCI